MNALLLLSAFNGIWQGCVLTLLLALALRWSPRLNAATTCGLWMAAYVLVASLPFVDFFTAQPVKSEALAQAVRPVRVRLPAASGALVRRPLPVAARVRPEQRASAPRAFGLPDATAALRAATALADRVAPAAIVLWLVVACLLIARLMFGYARVLALKRSARQLQFEHAGVNLDRGRASALGSSPQVRVPCAIGFRYPMIVFPAALAAALDTTDLARVVEHEHAHLKRYDDCANAVERLIRALLFFHPALYYIARRIDFDREVACDDRVVDVLGAPLEYAECLTRIVERHVRGPRFMAVPGFFVGRSQVAARVDRLIERRTMSPRLARAALASIAAVAGGAALLVRAQVPVVAAPACAAAPGVSHAHIGKIATAPVHVAAIHSAAVHVAAVHIPTIHLATIDIPPIRIPAIQLPAVHTTAIRVAPVHVPAVHIVAAAQPGRADVLDVVANGSVPRPSVDELVALADHGVDGTYAATMRQLLNAQLSPSQLIALADHGVRPAFVRDLAALGYFRFTAEELVALADAGVTADLVKRLTDDGLRGLGAGELIKLANAGGA